MGTEKAIELPAPKLTPGPTRIELASTAEAFGGMAGGDGASSASVG
jgi:hypothetical protein